MRPWLATIARNTALAHLRMKKNKVKSQELEETMGDSALGPDQVSAHKDDLSLVLNALEGLPEKYRTPLVLFYREDQSVTAVAEALGLSKDATKQRLKRGRDELRGQVESTLAKTLRRTAPTAAFTATVAGVLTTMAPPAASAATGLSLSSVTTSSGAASTTVAAMNTSKLSLTAAALIGLAAIPAGYGMRALLTKETSSSAHLTSSSASLTPQPFDRDSITIPPSEVVTEWKRLQEEYGTSAEVMPQLYTHIESLPEGFLKEGLFSVLVTEWVATDARGGFDFLRNQKGGDWRKEQDRRTAFLEEWLRLDSADAIEGVQATGKRWENYFEKAAIVLAQHEPDFFIEHLGKIMPGRDESSQRVLALLAEHDDVALRKAAIAALQSRSAGFLDEALEKAVKVWAARDGQSALDWALAYKGEEKDDVLVAALAGRATVDPMGALRQGDKLIRHRLTRKNAAWPALISIAAKEDLEGTLAWYASVSSKGGHAYDSAMSTVIAKELLKDPITFLNRLESRGEFEKFAPVFHNLYHSEALSTRWQEVSAWLSTRPTGASQIVLSSRLAQTLAFDDPPAALKFADGVTDPQLRLKLRRVVAKELVASPSLDAANYYLTDHPEWSREFTLAAFERIGSYSDQTGLRQYPLEIESWTQAVEKFEGEDLKSATSQLTRAYLLADPTAAFEWVEGMPEERLATQEREDIFSEAFQGWMYENEAEALDWISQKKLGSYHSSCACQVVDFLSRRAVSLEEVWPWFESISEERDRKQAFQFLESGYQTTSALELSERFQDSNIPEEEKSFYLEKLSPTQSAK